MPKYIHMLHALCAYMSACVLEPCLHTYLDASGFYGEPPSGYPARLPRDRRRICGPHLLGGDTPRKRVPFRDRIPPRRGGKQTNTFTNAHRVTPSLTTTTVALKQAPTSAREFGGECAPTYPVISCAVRQSGSQTDSQAVSQADSQAVRQSDR
eukprot:GHVU01070747.1.p1 GENE.GHVU01070747.1~~GHVU01070747.1.p1  ORF type:complete len:153 (-),score=6.55 GHVU01070747.1:39-497(-)